MRKWFLGVALGLLGCSSSGGPGNAAAGAGSAGVGGSGAGTANGGSAGLSSIAGNSNGGASSGGTSSAAGAAVGGASAAFTSTLVSLPQQSRGSLSVEQYSTDKVTFTANIDLNFGYTRGQWDGCTRNQLGACWYYDCPAGSNPIGASGNVSPIYYDAGTATITSIQPAISLMMNSGSGQYALLNSEALWPLAGGSTVTVSLAGEDPVPAFTLPIATPPMVWLTSINGEATPTSIMRSDGMKLVWTSAGSGNVSFYVYELTGTRPAAVCQFDAPANAGELPAAVLEKLDPGTGYSLQFRGDLRADLMVGTWDMSGFAYSFGTDVSTAMTKIELK